MRGINNDSLWIREISRGFILQYSFPSEQININYVTVTSAGRKQFENDWINRTDSRRK